ncbi:hypothetical protein [Candidatus Enterococcus courvalinii]|uniref:ASCH domain-containing protein n=1 Tax=Candidatus Enterococcus courvalinii TaxID=2815329 RepID=A0ABS3HZ93_9ENTE|nr:hypothetical protein [Enterococcus sp. MSG2901]MBO0481779.1 hypothetical protein [Enterococcus sp. MSG2901]
MKKEEIILGQTYECHAIGLKKKVTGEIIKKLENSVILCVEEYDSIDHAEVQDKAGKVMAKYSEVYPQEASEYCLIEIA